jgi:non-specific riboncleoside hydrolase
VTTRLVIDTDVALGVTHEGRPRDIDDGFAIVEALNLESLDLLAVTTVYGNAPLDDVDRVARELVALKQSEVPVWRGAASAMPQQGPLPPPNAAVQRLAALLRNQHLTIAAIGPLTNMGLLVHHFPECIANIDAMIVVAGRSPGSRFYIGSAGPVQDFNFENDVRAMALLLDAEIPLVLAGFELTSQVVITDADLATIDARGTATASYLYRNSLAWFQHWTREFPTERGFHPWDSAAIAWLTHPELFVTEQRRVRIVPPHGKQPALLECDATGSGRTTTYCTAFVSGGAETFVAEIVGNVY